EGLTFADKLLMAAFQSATLRTAGFDAIGQGNLSPADMLVGILLMFIGASPASTGGGIKTTTFFIALVTVVSVIRQKEDYNIGKRRLSVQQVRKAQAILFMALSVVVVDTFLICFIQSVGGIPMALPDVVYEVVSACATVGLSTGITASLFPLSKLILIATMFAGRVGLLTVTLALSGNPQKNNAVRYPEERIMVG
ncbi:MAG: TrkH family potassium uptake protein, partial [Clostridia bacterium]|nr:TrkH family potassium uptake protein [Clostridia bacterium]